VSRVSDLFRRRRQELGLSEDELAEKAGYTRIGKGVIHIEDLEDPNTFEVSEAWVYRFGKPLGITMQEVEEAQRLDLKELDQPVPLDYFGVKLCVGVGIMLPLPDNCSLDEAVLITESYSRQRSKLTSLQVSGCRCWHFHHGRKWEVQDYYMLPTFEGVDRKRFVQGLAERGRPQGDRGMKGISSDGFFVRISTGEIIQIHEHASDAIKDPERFGLTQADVEAFGPRPKNFGEWRRRVLAHVLGNGWVRARGDGRGEVSIEFPLGLDQQETCRAVRGFLEAHCDDFLWVRAGGLDVSDSTNVRRATECSESLANLLAKTDEELAQCLFGGIEEAAEGAS